MPFASGGSGSTSSGKTGFSGRSSSSGSSGSGFPSVFHAQQRKQKDNTPCFPALLLHLCPFRPVSAAEDGGQRKRNSQQRKRNSQQRKQQKNQKHQHGTGWQDGFTSVSDGKSALCPFCPLPCTLVCLFQAAEQAQQRKNRDTLDGTRRTRQTRKYQGRWLFYPVSHEASGAVTRGSVRGTNCLVFRCFVFGQLFRQLAGCLCCLVFRCYGC